MPGREDLIQQNINRAVSRPQLPAVGVPQVPSQTTSGTGTSPGNGRTVTEPFGANVVPSVKKNFQIKEKLLRPALTSHYQCWFNPPGPVLNWLTEKGLNYPINAELISLSCSEASLPGSSFMTNEINDDHTGVTERHAYRRAYDDRVDFTFYVDHGRSDGNYNVLWFFEKWMQYIANEQDAFGLDTRNFHYRVRFPEDYYTDNLFINKFERDFTGDYLQYKFMQAYPISLNSIPVSYDSSQLLKVTVSFTYTRYLTRRSNLVLELEPGGQQPAVEVPKKPEYYGPGLPGEQANELRRGLLEDFIVRQQNNPGSGGIYPDNLREPVFGVDTTGEFGQTGSNLNRNPLGRVNPGIGEFGQTGSNLNRNSPRRVNPGSGGEYPDNLDESVFGVDTTGKSEQTRSNSNQNSPRRVNPLF